ncbi:MAG: SDR family NAD(P)-dependent oxidoreductase [Marinilabiliaceae bacterium]|nr:SDR family NAD(P)-dependent oxidoreductase [Marinilabiliaceae bacterium]
MTVQLPRTALITGPTSGIGHAYVKHLAKEGWSLILVGRNVRRLNQIKQEINGTFGTQVQCLVADLSVNADILRVEAYIQQDHQLELLINNAGFGLAAYFIDLPIEDQLKMVDVHLISTIRFSQAVIPAMIKKGGGQIINVSSLGAFFNLPGSVMYNTTKAALVTFSQTLQREVMHTGVKIQVLCPGFTPTSFHRSINGEAEFLKAVPKFLWTPVDQVVHESIKGIKTKKVVCIPGRINRLIYFMHNLPLIGTIMQHLIQKQRNAKSSEVYEAAWTYNYARKWLKNYKSA